MIFHATLPEDSAPNVRLGLVARALVELIPKELPVLLAASRYIESRALLERLADRTRTDAALGELTPEEAGVLADRLLSGWAGIDPRPLPPAAMLIRLSERPGMVALAHSGLHPGCEIIWEGAVVDPDAPNLARTTSVSGHVRARIRGKAMRDDQRCILVEDLRP